MRSVGMLGVALALFLVAVPAGASEDLKGRLDRLQELVEKQQQTIGELETKLSVANSEDLDAARVEEIKKVVREVLADADFRESLYPDVMQVGYDHGFYIKSSDEKFLLNINGMMKFRWTGTNRQTDNPRLQGRNKQDDINGFEIEQLYLTFMGHIHTDKLTYRVTVRGDTDQSHDWITYYAWVNYEIAPELQIRAGLVDIPQGRQFLYWHSQWQFVDRSLAEEVFALGRSIGIKAHGTLAKRLSYQIGMFNGINDESDSPGREQLDTNFSYAARLVGHILGDPITSEPDLEYSKDPQWEVGSSFYYNDDNGDNRGPGLLYNIPERIRRGRGIGGNATADATGTDYFGFGMDTAFKYRGFSLAAEWYLRTVDSDSEFSQWELLTTRSGSSHYQGGYIQAGYFIIPKKVELAARMGGVWDNGGDNTWEYTFGVSYYPYGSHNFKIQADYTRIEEASVDSDWINVNQNDEINMFRVQLQAAFE
ncbi:MAG: hypothetical protein JXQ73_04195 [Phycisphaerae bacterium]|nr:hypothetical protein [Phycisphaerae bacterium]